MYTNYTPKDEARFWKKVDKSPHPQDCWIWTACSSKDGYGRMAWGPNGRGMTHANRISFLLKYGPFPQNLEVCHSCDNPSCVNPDHLFLGTHLENVADMDGKGRRADTKGEMNGNCKTSNESIEAIRSMLLSGLTQKEVADSFNLSQSYVSKIKRRVNRNYTP